MTRLLTSPPTAPWAIRRVTDRAELEAVYRLRYEVYVKELGQPFGDEVHRRGMIEELADATGHVLGAYSSAGQLVGSLRFNPLRYGIPHPYKGMFAAADFEIADPDVTTISSRFIVIRCHRCSTVGAKLVTFGYRETWGLGVRRDLIVAPAGAVGLYTRLGYVLLRSDLEHPNFGPVSLYELDLTADTLFRRLALREVPV